MRPLPAGLRVAMRLAVRLPVIWMSPGAVGSSLVMEVILVNGAPSQLSETAAETVTATGLLFAGESTLGLAVKFWITGAVVSATVRGIFREALLPAASVTVTVITYCPCPRTVPAAGF